MNDRFDAVNRLLRRFSDRNQVIDMTMVMIIEKHLQGWDCLSGVQLL